MNNLSVVIICKNNETTIGDTIHSALFANEVLLLDSGSTDDTIKIAENLGVKIEFQEWLGFGKQKNEAIKKAINNWVFVLDSDEQISFNLQNEIKEILKNPKKDGYFVPRLNNFWGTDIKNCGLYPDATIRLFDKTKAKFNDVEIHESVQLKKNTGYLNNNILHKAYDSIDEFITKQNRYSTLSNKENSIIKAILSSYWTFFKLYFIKKGFLDGIDGFIISKLYSQYTFWKYIK
jgi:glycosyltransferase involved in cell wall biosynthesis